MRRAEPTVRELVQAATNAGWEIKYGKHIMLYPPDGARPIMVPHQLKCAKLRDQAKAARAAGLDV